MYGSLRVLRQKRHLIAVPTQPTAQTCAHDLHVVWGGQRLGVIVHPSGQSGSAQLCPCREDGQ